MKPYENLFIAPPKTTTTDYSAAEKMRKGRERTGTNDRNDGLDRLPLLLNNSIFSSK
jgi:hypothetical protein